MKEKLIAVLERFCPDNVYLQGTINENDAYPETFLTFFVDDSDFDAFFDDDANAVDWHVSVMLYSSNPANIQTMPPRIIAALKQEKFIPQGMGNDLYSDVDTHTGWAMDFIYRETINN